MSASNLASHFSVSITRHCGIDIMKKRLLFLGLLSLPFLTTKSEASKTKYVVPKDVTRINIKSWSPDGERVLNYTLGVEPGQKFEITPLDK